MVTERQIQKNEMRAEMVSIVISIDETVTA